MARAANAVYDVLNEVHGVGPADASPSLAQEEARHQVLIKLASVPGSGKPIPLPRGAFCEIMRTGLSYALEEVSSRARPFRSAPVPLPQSGAKAPRLEDVLGFERRLILLEGADRTLETPQ
eukprot:2841034-Pyramimonas_sp.AAC.1